MQTYEMKNARGITKMVLLADGEKPAVFPNVAAAALEAAKHPNAKPSKNNFPRGDNDRYFVRIHPAK